MRNGATRKFIALAVSLATILAMALTASASATTSTSPFAPAEGTSPEVPKLPTKYAALNITSLVVFADANSGDLWATDADGNGPVRLARTPKVIEEDPAGWFPWIVYQGTRIKTGNTDIYMISILGELEDWGKGRVKLTDNPAPDVNPSIIAIPSFLQTAAEPDADVDPATLIFGDPLILFSSGRRDGQGDCRFEVFFEYLNLTGPLQVSPCDKTDKFDPQFNNPFVNDSSFMYAYTGYKPTGSDIWIDDLDPIAGEGPTPAFRATNSGAAQHPTWAPYIDGGKDAPSTDGLAPTRQPAGDFPITYTRWDSPLAQLWTVSGSDDLTLSDNKNLLNPEWYNFSAPCVLFERTRTFAKVTVSYWCGEGPIEDLTDPDRFYPTGADWLGEPFIEV